MVTLAQLDLLALLPLSQDRQGQQVHRVKLDQPLLLQGLLGLQDPKVYKESKASKA